MSDAPGERRSFFKWFTGLLTAATGGIVALPGLGTIIHPARKDTMSSGKEPLKVPPKLDVLQPGVPELVEVRGELRDAWSRIPDVKLGSCWMVKSAEDGKVRAYSSVCPHLGCGIDFEAQSKRFVCPCHDSFFALDGRTLTGPSPRGMDELEVETAENGELKVKYRRFRTGTPKKQEV